MTRKKRPRKRRNCRCGRPVCRGRCTRCGREYKFPAAGVPAFRSLAPPVDPELDGYRLALIDAICGGLGIPRKLLGGG